MRDNTTSSILRDGAIIVVIALILLTVRVEAPASANTDESARPRLQHAQMLPDLIVPNVAAEAGFSPEFQQNGLAKEFERLHQMDTASVERLTRETVLNLHRQILIVRPMNSVEPARTLPARLSTKPEPKCSQSVLAVCS